MNPVMSERLKRRLADLGVMTSLPPGSTPYPLDSRFEPPCNTQRMTIEHKFAIGSFSYAVSGYYFACEIGRYTSIGEAVQIGRGNHPSTWLSTSPTFYLNGLFGGGSDFVGAPDLHHYRVELADVAPLPRVKLVEIGNDVWIGHAAFIKPGVKIGNGAIVGAYSVVTKDVPPYAVVAGNPAAVIRYRFPEELRRRLLACKWWELAPWQLRGIDVSRPGLSIGHLERRAAGTPPYQPGSIEYHSIVESEQ